MNAEIVECRCGRKLEVDANNFAACSLAEGGCGAVMSLFNPEMIVRANGRTQYVYSHSLKKLVPKV